MCRWEENGFDIGKDTCLQEVLLHHGVTDSVWSNVCPDAKIKQFSQKNWVLLNQTVCFLVSMKQQESPSVISIKKNKKNKK